MSWYFLHFVDEEIKARMDLITVHGQSSAKSLCKPSLCGSKAQTFLDYVTPLQVQLGRWQDARLAGLCSDLHTL